MTDDILERITAAAQAHGFSLHRFDEREEDGRYMYWIETESGAIAATGLYLNEIPEMIWQLLQQRRRGSIAW